MSANLRVGRLHVITDITVQSRYSHQQLATMACAGGADTIQLRDKRLDDDAFLTVAWRLREICTSRGVTFIVNDRVETARKVGADGVHLGRADMAVAHARERLGEGAIIGASAGSVEDILAATEAGADYVGFGHIFPTASKVRGTEPAGLKGLAHACANATIPVIAIGGISAENAGDVIEVGAWGIAVLGAVCTADDPRAATEQLREAMG